MADKFLSIIVLNFNRLHYSKQTIECILEKTTLPHELILVDNNSAQEGLREYLSSVKGNQYTKEVKLVFNNRNYGTGGGRNSGTAVSNPNSTHLLHFDDDFLVPGNYDHLLTDVCDKVPNLGQTGVNVEPTNYPIQTINGVECCIKQGNIGEAMTCMSRKVFERVGYFNYFATYGIEGAAFYFRLKHIGLISAYIVPRGVHLDTDEDKAYRIEKTKAHTGGSPQLKAFDEYLRQMRETNNVYIHWDQNFTTVDEHIFTNNLILKDRK